MKMVKTIVAFFFISILAFNCGNDDLDISELKMEQVPEHTAPTNGDSGNGGGSTPCPDC